MRLEWSSAEWINEPESVEHVGDETIVTAVPHSDFWNVTSYGFTHTSGHGLLLDLSPHQAMEIEFFVNFDQQFDQAGLILYADPNNWIKTGVEFADGFAQLGAVVTARRSDWSVARVPEWQEHWVRLRLSRTQDSVTIRAGIDDLRLVRVAPIDARFDWKCGPMMCSPTRGGLSVRFRNWSLTEADAQLH